MLFSSEVCSDFQRAVPSSSPVLKCTWCLGGRCLCVLISFNDGENSWAKKAKSRGTIVRWQWALGVGWQLSSDWMPGNNLSHDLQEPEGLRNHFSEKTCLANTSPTASSSQWVLKLGVSRARAPTLISPALESCPPKWLREASNFLFWLSFPFSYCILLHGQKTYLLWNRMKLTL